MVYYTLYTWCEINNINGNINLSFLIIKNDSIYNVMILFIVLYRKQISNINGASCLVAENTTHRE